MWKFNNKGASGAGSKRAPDSQRLSEIVQPVAVNKGQSAGSSKADVVDLMMRPSVRGPIEPSDDDHVYFKDLKVSAGDDSETPGSPDPPESGGGLGPLGLGAGLSSAYGRGGGLRGTYGDGDDDDDDDGMGGVTGVGALGGRGRPGSSRDGRGGGLGASSRGGAVASGVTFGPSSGSLSGGARPRRVRGRRVDRMKLIVIFVGLPARGKTFLCNKLMCYLNWLGHPTRHFNVGAYRRVQCAELNFQDADFFDPNNPSGLEARARALAAALEDMERWLSSDGAQVAMIDATNSTVARRKELVDRFQGRYEYVFVESVCNDEDVLARNYRMKMLYSPDYKDMPREDALRDFLRRIEKYEAAYETISERSLHFIRLIDMVTGRGHMDVNRISGYLPGKMVMYLMQVCHSASRPRRIWLTRHGESEFNTMGKIGGNSGLSKRGMVYAKLLPAILADRVPSRGFMGGHAQTSAEDVRTTQGAGAETGKTTAGGLQEPSIAGAGLGVSGAAPGAAASLGPAPLDAPPAPSGAPPASSAGHPMKHSVSFATTATTLSAENSGSDAAMPKVGSASSMLSSGGLDVGGPFAAAANASITATTTIHAPDGSSRVVYDSAAADVHDLAAVRAAANAAIDAAARAATGETPHPDLVAAERRALERLLEAEWISVLDKGDAEGQAPQGGPGAEGRAGADGSEVGNEADGNGATPPAAASAAPLASAPPPLSQLTHHHHHHARKEPVAVWTSTLARTIMTASGLPWPQVQWKALDEIQAGICDGMTYAEVKARLPGEFELRRRDKLGYRYPSGESYQDVIQRLEPVATEVERVKQCVVIVSHQAVLRALYGYFMNRPLKEVPSIDIPLHTIMELTPLPDGTMAETRFHVDVDKAMRDPEIAASLAEASEAQAAIDEWGEEPAEVDPPAKLFARTPSLAALRAADLVERIASHSLVDSDDDA